QNTGNEPLKPNPNLSNNNHINGNQPVINNQVLPTNFLPMNSNQQNLNHKPVVNSHKGSSSSQFITKGNQVLRYNQQNRNPQIGSGDSNLGNGYPVRNTNYGNLRTKNGQPIRMADLNNNQYNVEHRRNSVVNNFQPMNNYTGNLHLQSLKNPHQFRRNNQNRRPPIRNSVPFLEDPQTTIRYNSQYMIGSESRINNYPGDENQLLGKKQPNIKSNPNINIQQYHDSQSNRDVPQNWNNNANFEQSPNIFKTHHGNSQNNDNNPGNRIQHLLKNGQTHRGPQPNNNSPTKNNNPSSNPNIKNNPWKHQVQSRIDPSIQSQILIDNQSQNNHPISLQVLQNNVDAWNEQYTNDQQTNIEEDYWDYYERYSGGSGNTDNAGNNDWGWEGSWSTAGGGTGSTAGGGTGSTAGGGTGSTAEGSTGTAQKSSKVVLPFQLGNETVYYDTDYSESQTGSPVAYLLYPEYDYNDINDTLYYLPSGVGGYYPSGLGYSNMEQLYPGLGLNQNQIQNQSQSVVNQVQTHQNLVIQLANGTNITSVSISGAPGGTSVGVGVGGM
ncbi:unnamed protein product, partial [Meganyctiphanes norvegica]